MAKVRTNFAGLRSVTARAKSALDRMGSQLTTDVIESMSKGVSPLFGVGRFAAYKNPQNYPAGKKASRPVDLFLSGELYASIGHRIEGKKIVFGVLDSSQEQKAIGLTQGWSKSKTGETIFFGGPRPFIPDTNIGQRFNAKIVNNLFRILRKEVLGG